MCIADTGGRYFIVFVYVYKLCEYVHSVLIYDVYRHSIEYYVYIMYKVPSSIIFTIFTINENIMFTLRVLSQIAVFVWSAHCSSSVCQTSSYFACVKKTGKTSFWAAF